MVNCAHPTHFLDHLSGGATWATRVRGIRANASRLSHAELDAATELDRGDIAELAGLYADLQHTIDLPRGRRLLRHRRRACRRHATALGLVER